MLTTIDNIMSLSSNRSPHHHDAPQASSPFGDGDDKKRSRLPNINNRKMFWLFGIIIISVAGFITNMYSDEWWISSFSKSPPAKKSKSTAGKSQQHDSINNSLPNGSSSNLPDTCPSPNEKAKVDLFTVSKTETSKSDHCRRLYPIPPTNPSLPSDYSPLKSLNFKEELTTLFHSDTEVTRKLFDKLIVDIPRILRKYHRFGPHVPELDQDFKPDRFTMESSSRDGNYITCDNNYKKNGRSTLLRNAKLTRYPNVLCTRIISNRSIYPPALLNEYEEYIKNDLYEIIKPNDDEDLDSYSGIIKYEERTGLSVYFFKLVKNVKDYGCKKRGMCKAIELNLDEIAFYKAFQKKGKPEILINNPMESLHGNYMINWKKGIDGINVGGKIMVSLMTKLMYNQNPQWLTWEQRKHIASWAPDLGSFVPVNLEDDGSASTEPISQSQSDLYHQLLSIIRSNIQDSTKMMDEVNQLLNSDIELVLTSSDVDTIIEQIQRGLQQTTVSSMSGASSAGNNNSYVLIFVVTEYIYYCVDGGKNKPYTKNFIDPVGVVKYGWDTSSVTPAIMRTAQDIMSSEIDDMKKGFVTGNDDEHMFVYHMYFDTNSLAFGDLKGAEILIRSKGFRPLGVWKTINDVEHGYELGQMKQFWFW